MIDPLTDEVVNTTQRYHTYCRKVADDGRVCSLYSPHVGLCKPKHGTESDHFVGCDPHVKQ